MPGKTNTEKIEALEEITRSLEASLGSLGTNMEWIIDGYKKGADTTVSHNARIIAIEQQLLSLAELKGFAAAITAIEKEFIAFRKDLESLSKWKEDQKKERDEADRRWWSFGPNITAALITGFIALLGIGINILFTVLYIKGK